LCCFFRQCICIHLNKNLDKFNTLVYMTRKLFSFAKGECCAESADNPMFQEVLLGGHLYQKALKVSLCLVFAIDSFAGASVVHRAKVRSWGKMSVYLGRVGKPMVQEVLLGGHLYQKALKVSLVFSVDSFAKA
jgi:DNA-directed RNA polymerase beta subunit